MDKIQNLTRITDRFFELQTTEEFNYFLQSLDPSRAAESVFLRYANSWEIVSGSEPSKPFSPHRFISQDLSAAMLVSCPCIFLGTNNWATFSSLKHDEVEACLKHFENLLHKVRNDNPHPHIVLSIIPEKDYLLDRMFMKNGAYDDIHSALWSLSERLKKIDIDFVFDEQCYGMGKYQTAHDFEYPDTHLPSRNYLQIFSKVLEYHSVPWANIEPYLTLEEAPDFQDLVGKMDGLPPNPINTFLPITATADVVLSEGNSDFQSPLGDTWQKLTNKNPLIDKKILILGDSHSSIFSKRKLTYLFGSTYEECEFYWNPCCVRSEVKSIRNDYVLLEISQRFVFNSLK